MDTDKKTTNEEMAVNLISTATAMESTSGQTPLTASMRAGAAALRAMEWKPLQKIDDEEELPPPFVAGFRYPNGVWYQQVEGNPNHALRAGFTHYLTLPAPPEGV